MSPTVRVRPLTPDRAVLQRLHDAQRQLGDLQSDLVRFARGMHLMREQGFDAMLEEALLDKAVPDPNIVRLGGEASREIDLGFPSLSRFLVVSQWGVVEATCRDFAVEVLATMPDRVDRTKIRKVNIPCSDVLPGDGARAFAEAILKRFSPQVKSSNQGDVLHIQMQQLSIAGVRVRLGDASRDSLSELKQFRHVVVHNCGIVNDRLVDGCPWREDLVVGGPVPVTLQDVARYFTVCKEFIRGISTEFFGENTVPTAPDNG